MRSVHVFADTVHSVALSSFNVRSIAFPLHSARFWAVDLGVPGRISRAVELCSMFVCCVTLSQSIILLLYWRSSYGLNLQCSSVNAPLLYD